MLFSDGRARDREGLEEMARRYGQMNLPIHVVPVGDPARGGDVAIVNIGGAGPGSETLARKRAGLGAGLGAELRIRRRAHSVAALLVLLAVEWAWRRSVGLAINPPRCPHSARKTASQDSASRYPRWR